ncbi:hypothetical protein LCGC14_1114530, partial [marine sediment metagenome]
MTIIIATLKRGGGGTAPFPTTIQEDARLAHVSVGDLSERDTLPEWRRISKMTCFVIGENKTYRLGNDITIPGQLWTEEAAAGNVQTRDEKNQPDGYVGLNAQGFVDPQYIRSIWVQDYFTPADEAARFALSAKTGDIAHQLDTNFIYIKKNNNAPPTGAGDWADITTAATVTSVNGLIGAVQIDFDTLLSFGSSSTQFETAVDNSTAVSQLGGQIANNDVDIATLFGLVNGIINDDSSVIPLWDVVKPDYIIGNNVIYDDGGTNKNLYRCTAVPPAGVAPNNLAYWELVGDFYTQQEIDNALGNKADLVGGYVPVGQLPPSVFSQTIVVEDIAERDAYPDKETGMRFYVVDATADPTVNSGGRDYVYDPTSPSADPAGFIKITLQIEHDYTTTIWIDLDNGNNSNSGLRGAPLKTVEVAWTKRLLDNSIRYIFRITGTNNFPASLTLDGTTGGSDNMQTFIIGDVAETGRYEYGVGTLSLINSGFLYFAGVGCYTKLRLQSDTWICTPLFTNMNLVCSIAILGTPTKAQTLLLYTTFAEFTTITGTTTNLTIWGQKGSNIWFKNTASLKALNLSNCGTEIWANQTLTLTGTTVFQDHSEFIVDSGATLSIGTLNQYGSLISKHPTATVTISVHNKLAQPWSKHLYFEPGASGIVATNVEDAIKEVLKPNFGAKAIKTLSAGVAASGTDRNLVIAAETGTADDMIELTGLTVGAKVLLRADTGDTITVKHNDAGATIKILIQDDADFVLDEVHPLELILTDTNELVQVYEDPDGQYRNVIKDTIGDFYDFHDNIGKLVIAKAAGDSTTIDIDANQVSGLNVGDWIDVLDLSAHSHGIDITLINGAVIEGSSPGLATPSIKNVIYRIIYQGNITGTETWAVSVPDDPTKLSKTLTADQDVASNVSFSKQVKGGAATVSFSAIKIFSMDNGTFQKMPVTATITSLAISNEVN